MNSFLAFISLAAFLGEQALAVTVGPVGNLPIVNANIAPDGFSRPAVLAGGTFPGTLITGQKGDNFKLNVVDQLTDASMFKTTSIHWHGFFQAGTNYADGPAFVNQCPIASGNSFVYDFNAVNQAGTFWYHSHLSVQYCDGLRGAFVVYDPNDPHKSRYDVDDESTVITLADWYHTKALDAIAAFPFPTPDSTLINGLGRWGGAGGTVSDLAVVTVEFGKRYRLRVVSISCDPNFVFSIDGHSLEIIEVDSVNHVPHTVDSIQVFAGQRYSVVLNANQDVGNYWIRANPNLGTTGFAGGINSAVLRYAGALDEDPTTTQTGTNALLERDLVPLENPGAPGPADINAPDSATFKKFNLAFSLDANLKLLINGAAWESPTVPVLLQILSGASSAQDLMPSASIIELPRDTVIQLSMPAGVAGGPHPFHLHGHAFDVVRGAGQATPNFVNPPRRDVVSIGAAGDNVTIRFLTDNPGPWFLHCHIDWHLEAGFAMVFAENMADTPSVNSPPTSWSDLCPIYNALPASDH